MSNAAAIQSTALSFANSNAAMMDNFAMQAASFAYTGIDMSSSWESPGYVMGYNGGVVNTPANIVLPSITATRPVAPTLDAYPSITLSSEPTLVAAEPVLSMPSRPSSTLPVAPGDAPAFNSPAIPDTPVISLPVAPSFNPVAIPVAPALDNPTFTAIIPDDTLVAPSETFAFVEHEYSSALLDALKAKLMKDLVEGGYGIEPADEEGLWERARERELLNMEAVISEASRQAAAPRR